MLWWWLVVELWVPVCPGCRASSHQHLAGLDKCVNTQHLPSKVSEKAALTSLWSISQSAGLEEGTQGWVSVGRTPMSLIFSLR